MMSRYAHVTYCDDIRAEVNGKTSLMGVYSDTMVASRLPASVKLCAVVTAKTTSDKPFDGFNVRVKAAGQIIAEMEVSSEEYQESRQHLAGGAADQYIQAQFMFSPLVIEEPCKVEVTFSSGEDVIECNPLIVELAKEGELTPAY